MLNGGADILTVRELLAHASPEMNLRYAKLFDDTKRKAFESVINQGLFSFDLNGTFFKSLGLIFLELMFKVSGSPIFSKFTNVLW